MTKEQLINKINDALFNTSKIEKEEFHPFKDFTIEKMEELRDKFKVDDQGKYYKELPANEIWSISLYLQEKQIIDFEIEEVMSQDDAWFQVLIYRAIGIKKNSIELFNPIIWNTNQNFNHLKSLDDFIEELACIQLEIDDFKFYNSFK